MPTARLNRAFVNTLFASAKYRPIANSPRPFAVDVILYALNRDEVQRYAVVAPPLAGGLWTIVEYMPLMAAAACAVVLGARPKSRII